MILSTFNSCVSKKKFPQTKIPMMLSTSVQDKYAKIDSQECQSERKMYAEIGSQEDKGKRKY